MGTRGRFIARSVVFTLVAFTGWALGDAGGVGPVAQAAEVPAPNPPIAKACGIDVSLVLDASGSVESAHAVGDVRDAAAELLDALKDTGSTARVLQFATLAEELAPRQLVDDVSMGNNGDLDDAVDGYFNPQPQRPSNVTIRRYDGSGNPASEGNWDTSNSSIQYTNWQQALDLTATDTAELVVFITDGDPTGYDFDRPADPFDQGPPPDVGIGTDSTAQTRELTQDRSILAANAVKSLGSRVLAIGVGAALQNQASVTRLTQVSGPVVARTIAGFDIETTDVALIEDFDALADAMRTLGARVVFAVADDSQVRADGDERGVRPGTGLGHHRHADRARRKLRVGAPARRDWCLVDVEHRCQRVRPVPVGTEPCRPCRRRRSSPKRSNRVSSPGGPATDNDFHCEFKDVDGNVRVIDDDFTVGVGSATFALAPIGAEIGTCALWNSFDYQPAILLTKANTPTSVRGDLDPPAVVTSTYVATNPGNTPLVDVFVVDNKCGPATPVPPVGFNVGDTNQNGRLETGEAWQFSCVREAVTSEVPPAGITVVNTAVVQGTDPSGERGHRHGIRQRHRLRAGDHGDQARQRATGGRSLERIGRDLHVRGHQHRQHTARHADARRRHPAVPEPDTRSRHPRQRRRDPRRR